MLVLPKKLKTAILRGEYMKSCADMEMVGVPLDVPNLRYLQENWDDIRQVLVGDSLNDYDIFEGLHFSHEKFAVFLKDRGLEKSWPRTEKSGIRRLDKDTWKSQAQLHPELEPVREVYKTVTMPKLNIACDEDGRNRVLLGAFGTITSRNAPSGNKENGSFIFAPAKWVRFLIKPPEGMALAYLDWSNQEYGVCAVLSGDRNMIRSYESGDPYLQFAILAGAAPPGATKESHPQVRKLFKSATLAIGYGQKVWGFEKQTGASRQTAEKVFNDYRRVYRRFLEWRERQIDEYGIQGRITTVLGWPLHRGPLVKENTVINFGGQANAAEMMRLAATGIRRRGVDICCPVHDAFLIQAPTDKIQQATAEAMEAMNEASRTILRGYTLRVDCAEDVVKTNGELRRGDVTRHPQRFFSSDGESVWKKIAPLLPDKGV